MTEVAGKITVEEEYQIYLNRMNEEFAAFVDDLREKYDHKNDDASVYETTLVDKYTQGPLTYK